MSPTRWRFVNSFCFNENKTFFILISTYKFIHFIVSYFTVNVDEFLQEIETLSVQDMPRSASSLSVRTDASGAAVIIKIHNMRFIEFFSNRDRYILCDYITIFSIFFNLSFFISNISYLNNCIR